VVIIGGGPGGYATALYGAAAGLSMAIVEMDKVGGTCLHRGCVPAKEFLETAAVFRTVSGSAAFGVTAGSPGGTHPALDFSVSQARKQQVVEQLFNGLSGLLKGRGVTVFNGRGTMLPGHRVQIADNDGSTTEIAGTDVVLAAGSVPRTIPGFDVDGELVMTSDEMLALERLPSSVAVVGGGAIGCEFASLLSDLGSTVTVFEALPAILNGCDEDVVRTVARSFRKRGIDVKVGVQLQGHTPDPSGKGTVVLFGDGEKHRSHHADRRRGSVGGGRPGGGGSPAGPCRLRPGDRGGQEHSGGAGRPGGLRAGALGHLLSSRGGVRGDDRGSRQARRVRRGGEEGPVRRQ
jgi:dihydrolipoamide dehydrogenase